MNRKDIKMYIGCVILQSERYFCTFPDGCPLFWKCVRNMSETIIKMSAAKMIATANFSDNFQTHF